MNRRAFTVIEVMIVVLIIGILLMIAVPLFLRARERSQAKVCISALKEIEYAKELYADQNKLKSGDPCIIGDLWPEYIRGGSLPNCPGGGIYDVRNIGESPMCTIQGPEYPHRLDY
jgi:prepilin-type N-terminal cleavage/methylation domain-containing protein